MTTYPKSVQGSLNFSASTQDAGVFDIDDPESGRQSLRPVNVELLNARYVEPSPSLSAEGLAFVAHAVDNPRWEDRDWLDHSYANSCLDLVKQLTGAAVTLQIFTPILRRSDRSGQSVATASFIHLDQTRDAYRPHAEQAAKAQGYELGKSAIVFNVWKAISPPPQNLPLAVCDRRTIALKDYVQGMYVENEIRSPYVGLTYSGDAPTWYYIPDMAIDESLIFVSADLDPAHSLGCAHTAFSPPELGCDYVPRASVEVRVLALFD